MKNKVDYTSVLFKTSKEFVTVIRRTIKFEKLEITGFRMFESYSKVFDVMLFAGERLLIIRGYRGKKEAHIQEFKIERWREFSEGQIESNVKQFLEFYNATELKLDQVWITA